MPFPANFKKAPPFGKGDKSEKKGNPFAKPKKLAKGGMVMRGTGAATRGKNTRGVI
jgi:hypothetical protein